MTTDTDDAWVQLRVLIVNTHVGMLLLTAVRWLLRRDRYHLVLLQEVSSPLARMRLRLAFPLATWRLVGTRPASTGRGSSGTIVATRRSRLRHTGNGNPLLTPQRFVNGVRDKWHPERRITWGTYIDRRTRRDVFAMSLHPWHTRGGPQSVIDEHNRQVRAYATTARERVRDGFVTIVGGDVNATRGSLAGERLGPANGLRVVSWEHIDALLVSATEPASPERIRVQSVEHIDLSRFRGGEVAHKAISAVLLIRRMPH